MRHSTLILALAATLLNLPQVAALAAPTITRASAAAPKPLAGKAWRFADQGYREFNKGNYQAAQKATLSAIKLRPDLPRLRLLLIYALQKDGKAQQAQSEARKALAAGLQDPVLVAVASSGTLIPSSPTADTSSAVTLSADPAITADRSATSAAQDAYAAYAEKNYATAIERAQQAVTLEPDNERWQRLLITTLAAGNDAQATRALSLIDDRLSLHPDDSDLLMQRAYLHQRFGRSALALNDFRRARATGQAPASAVLDEGYAQASAGDKRGAVQTLKSAIDDADAGHLPMLPPQRYTTRQNIASLEREWGGYMAAGYRAGRATSSGTGGTPLVQPGDAVFSIAEGSWRPSAFLNTPTRIFEAYGRAMNTLHSSDSTLAAQIDPCIGAVDTTQTFSSVSGLPSTVGALGLRFTPSTELGFTIGIERQFNIGRASRTNGVGAADCHALDPSKVSASYETEADSGPWLLYGTYALYKGTELRTDVPSWFTIDGYLQAGYYWQNSSADVRGRMEGNAFSESGRLIRDRTFITAETRIGHSFRNDQISNNLVLFPHVVIAADKYWDKTRIRTDKFGTLDLQGSGASWGAAAGPGLTVRYWFRGDHYGAPRSYADFTVQYRFNIGGGAADRTKGLFLNLLVSY